jgi:hypothetical protein
MNDKLLRCFSLRRTRSIFFAASLFINAPGFALEVGDVKLSGFASAVAAITDNKAPYLREGFANNLNFVGDTLLGLQVDSKLGEQTSFSTQLIANDENNYSVDAEWLYIGYRNSDGTLFRFGRLRSPKYMLSPYLFVSAAYPWMRPPTLVYQVDPITQQTGVDAIYQKRFGDAVLTLQPAVAQIRAKAKFFGVQDVGFESDYHFALRADLEYGNLTLHSYFDKTKFTAVFPASDSVPSLPAVAKNKVIGLQYSAGAHRIVSEYAGYDVSVDVPGSTVMFKPHGVYLSYIYTFGNWNPYLTWSQLRVPPITLGTGSNSSAIEIGTSYTHQHNIVSKYEVHYGKAEEGTGSFESAFTIPEDPTVLLFSAGVSIVF